MECSKRKKNVVVAGLLYLFDGGITRSGRRQPSRLSEGRKFKAEEEGYFTVLGARLIHSSQDVKRSRGQFASFLCASVSNRVRVCSHAVRAN